MHITLKVEHFSFHAFSVWVAARFDVLFKLISVTKTIFFLHVSVFWKSYKSFWCYWALCMQHHPYQNLHWYSLTSSKNIWPKISVAYFAKWFQSIFTVGGWRMYPFTLPLLAPAYIPTQSCERASFWHLNPVQARSCKSKPGSGPTFISEARFRAESQINRGS